METINTELALADLQTIEKAIPRLEKEAKTAKERQPVLEAVKAANEWLQSGKPLSQSTIDRELLHELHLLTAKPFLYVFNVDAAELADKELRAKLQTLVSPAQAIFLDAKTEAELAELSDEDAMELLESIGLTEPGLATLARVGFDALGLQTYLTAGPKEARAWTIHKGDTAPKAAGVIHTDFEKGFIKAEIVSFADLIEAGSMSEAKSKGKVRMEGKEYVMADGDVVEFRFNV
jgi:GTP-binding protein YchF